MCKELIFEGRGNPYWRVGVSACRRVGVVSVAATVRPKGKRATVEKVWPKEMTSAGPLSAVAIARFANDGYM
jgi:hypothetical protein